MAGVERLLRMLEEEIPDLPSSELSSFLAEYVDDQIVGGYKEAVLRVTLRATRLGARRDEPPENQKNRIRLWNPR